MGVGRKKFAPSTLGLALDFRIVNDCKDEGTKYCVAYQVSYPQYDWGEWKNKLNMGIADGPRSEGMFMSIAGGFDMVNMANTADEIMEFTRKWKNRAKLEYYK